jgi:hypothetical protein
MEPPLNFSENLINLRREEKREKRGEKVIGLIRILVMIM